MNLNYTNDYNGRVNIMDSINGSQNQFSLHDRIPAHQTTSYRDALQGNHTETPLSRTFFSRENIQIIQNGIRAGVYKKSNGLYNISNQSEETLKIIMRSTFLMYSANMPNHITEQIESLNKVVLEYCVPRVFNEAKSHMQYLYDASTMAVPIERPIMSKEYKPVEFKGWF
jgi:hypothetical protein